MVQGQGQWNLLIFPKDKMIGTVELVFLTVRRRRTVKVAHS